MLLGFGVTLVEIVELVVDFEQGTLLLVELHIVGVGKVHLDLHLDLVLVELLSTIILVHYLYFLIQFRPVEHIL